MFKEINKIVVLTGGIKANGELSEDSLSRLLTALLIYQAIKKYSNKEPEILILGKSIQYNTNIAKYMKLLVTSIQPKYLKDVNIFTENESLDTYQNVKNLKNFVNSNDKIAIVTSAFHITRTKISIKNTFDKNFVQNNIIFVPCNYRYQYKISKYDFLPSIKNLETTNIALSEFVGIVYYKIYYSIKHKKTSN
ncbi:MAG: YdcF family protein [bacterium]